MAAVNLPSEASSVPNLTGMVTRSEAPFCDPSHLEAVLGTDLHPAPVSVRSDEVRATAFPPLSTLIRGGKLSPPCLLLP